MAFDFPSTPTTGQTYTPTGGPTYVWNGTAWVVLSPGSNFATTIFTATAGQTTFSVTYTVGAIYVYRNGVLLAPADFTATNGTSVVLANACNLGDTVEIISLAQVPYVNAVQKTGDTMTGTLNLPANGLVVGTTQLVASGGNVGIGTSSPTYRFEASASNPTRGIVAQINNTGSSSLTGSQLTFLQNTVNWWTIGQPAATDAFAVWRGRHVGADGTEVLRIDSFGNVGIGTSSPQTKLDITGSIRATGSLVLDNDNILYWGLGDGSSNIKGSSTADYLAFTTASLERMRINAAGYVTKQYTPAFSVTGPYNGNLNPISVSSGGGYTILWQGVILNNGSFYSTSTGRFTAPVAGMYFFSASLTNSDNSSGPYIRIRKNGSPVVGAISYATAYNGSSTSAVVQLAVNDYVDVFFGAFNTSVSIDLNYSNFCGFLVG